MNGTLVRRIHDLCVRARACSLIKDSPLLLNGKTGCFAVIKDLMVDSLNFVCGCSGFLPLQNELFLEVVKAHFVERLQDPEFYGRCGNRYPVRDEVQTIIDKARQHSRTGDVRIWTVVGKHRLKEMNWLDLDFEDVTENHVRRRERLESPLRSVLTKLYTNSTTSKATRYPKPQPSPSSGQQQQQQQIVHLMRGQSPAKQQKQQQKRQIPSSMQFQTSYGQQPVQQEPSLQRSHETMLRQPQQLIRQWGQLSYNLSTRPQQAPQQHVETFYATTTRTLPETDRSWELKGELSGLILYEDAMTTELLEEFNKSHPYVASLSSVVNEQMDEQANTCLAKRISKKWLDASPKIRWVCWLDASDPLTLTESYRKMARGLRADDNSMEQQAPKRGRLSPSSAANEFYQEYLSRFPLQFECLVVYVNVAHPEVFTEGFLPSAWLQDAHCQSTIRGVILSTPHPLYDGNMGPPYGCVCHHSIEWVPHWSESEKRYWWERLPQSNLPPLLDDVEEPDGIDRKLAYDGRAVTLIDVGCERPDRAGEIANQFARRWEMTENTERFSVWIQAGDDTSLREAYRLAIRRVTHSAPQNPLGNPVDLSIRVIGDELMSILMKVRELSPSKQWIMIFADVKDNEDFHRKFFSGKSNWWNSKGRFVITSTSDNVQVEVMSEDTVLKKKLAAIICQ